MPDFYFGGDCIKTKQICVKLPEDDAANLYKLAKQNNLTVAEQVRKLIAYGSNTNAYQQDEEKILANMRASLKQVLDPQVERPVKISVKNSMSASINLLYTAFLMHRMAVDDSARKLEPIMDEARRQGLLFVQLAKGSVDEFIKSAVEKIEELWGKL